MPQPLPLHCSFSVLKVMPNELHLCEQKWWQLSWRSLLLWVIQQNDRYEVHGFRVLLIRLCAMYSLCLNILDCSKFWMDVDIVLFCPFGGKCFCFLLVLCFIATWRLHWTDLAFELSCVFLFWPKSVVEVSNKATTGQSCHYTLEGTWTGIIHCCS